MDEWLIDDRQALRRLDESRIVGATSRAPAPTRPIAIRLHDVFIEDNQRLFGGKFGGADIRVDVLAVQGNMLDDSSTKFYTPTTARFGGIGNRQQLPLDDYGLLAFYGWPQHFLTLSVLVSRDTTNADDLAQLLERETSSKGFTDAVSSIAALAMSGGALAVKQAITTATALGALAYRVVRAATGNTVGAYRGDRLEFPDRFGIGRNPGEGSYRSQDLSLWFEVLSAADGDPPAT